MQEDDHSLGSKLKKLQYHIFDDDDDDDGDDKVWTVTIIIDICILTIDYKPVYCYYTF